MILTCVWCAGDDIVDAVPVDIARFADGFTRSVQAAYAREDEPSAAVTTAGREQTRELHDGGEALRRPEDDIAFTCGANSARIAVASADDEIGDPVPVDVARRAHGAAGLVTLVDAGEHEATA